MLTKKVAIKINIVHKNLNASKSQFVSFQYSTVQWGRNQNVVFEFAMREISVLPTLKASRELKNWYFTMNFFATSSSLC